MKKHAYIYIVSNKWNTTLYVGVTNDLIKRVWQHKQKLVKGFTQKYNIDKLVYYEQFESINQAITREKQLKGGSRKQKTDLIEIVNPEWDDLYESLS
ncbi:MAG TPA: GIY-YIG nuclease family protein [Candidatus Acidoferrales bacterium]|nr:GIY-YIG nuclease family protein [Candidatus Acidoferrales bacterium]